MSKDSNSSRPMYRRTPQSANENEFESSRNQISKIPSRAPLNSITDPSQYQSKSPSEQLKYDFREKPVSSKDSSSKKQEEVTETQPTSSVLKTPKVYGRGKSTNSELNSAQSTPLRSGPGISIAGAASGFTLARLPSQLGNCAGRRSVFPRVSRGISTAISQQLLDEVPQFELDDDPSFWNDHNVQVLIRIRPFSNAEMISQGYGRCLRQESAQTVVWQGHPETRFTFDHIACESISQEKLFIVAGLPMVDNCMSGYNSCMFAYGQTGSGKTYTMMGEIDKMDGNLSDDSGITPRIFEYLFTRISQEEESRKHERLTYSCKCSFLEIYNEQITDLLEPSSTNLQLREDSKKGVYVENLTEHSVRTVNDVLKLLQQGAANRKIAATHMNSESSRSHSVFTCVVESRWEKDSIAHLRFGRLNLVDLAGSERQKSSGAEGDRLKEAANINKSLSTLGMVIMSLVDLAQGKHRHVPYRDSRLTFLLQDSLGGNSKTTIIANVSPSTCSANETLSTLKFAQRAKLIQNNAKINEDASSGVIALQQQIQQLKDQLSYLMKHQNTPMKLIDLVPRLERSNLGYFSNRCEPSERTNMYECRTIEGGIVEEKHIKAALRGALRREKVAEIEVSRMKAEIEHLDHLTHQREEEVQRTKMMLRFREEKIKRLELLLGGLISADKFHMDENNNLREENLLLQAKIERNPEVTRFALENIRLLEQIRLLQDFYEQGERETLLAEISELRNQVLESLEDDKNSSDHQFSPTKLDQMQEPQDVEERERCMDLNSKLIREVDELRRQLANGMNSTQDTSSSINNVFLGSDSVDEVTSSNVPVDEVIYGKNEDKKEYILDWQRDNVHKQLKDAESLIETMKLEQSQLIRELESVQTENQRLMKMLDSDEVTERELDVQHENYKRKQYGLVNQDRNVRIEGSEGISILTLQAKLEKLSTDLKEAQILNGQYIEDHVTRLSQDHQTEVVRCEVEMETTRTIIHLQEEIDRLSMEFQVSLCSMAEENLNLRKHVAAKEDELRVSCAEWERATLDLTTFLIDGSRSLLEASTQVKSISTSFPNVNDWISEHVERAANICLEREETMLQLQKSLEDAQNTLLQMDHKLYSLKGAALALTEHQQLETSSSQEESIDELKVSRESLQFFSDTITSYLPITLENQPQILQQIRYELGEVNKRFRSMSACFSKVMNMNHHPDCRKDFTVAEGWTTDCSSSCSYSSVESVDNDDKPSSSDNYKCTSTRNEQPMVLNSDEGSNSEGAVLLIRKEARKAYESFVKLNDQLMAFPFGKKNQNCMEEVLSSSDLHASEKLNELCGDGHDQPTSTRAGAGTNNFGELDGKEKHSSAGSFFAKFEEAYGTIKEADCMLKAMVKANENANTLTAIWKQAGEELMADKESLTEEIKQLKSHVLSRDEEKEMLQDGIQFSLREKASILSFLEECFLAMQTSVEELFETARSHAIQAVEETQTFFCGLRSSSEDLMCKAIQNDIGIFVLHCQMSEYSQKFRRLNRISNSDKSSIQEHCPVADNLELSLVSRDDNSALHPEKCEDNGFEIPCMSRKETNEFDLVDSDSVDKSSELKRELERKDVLLKGLLFDFSLLQEFASHRKDIKNELEKLMIAMSQVQHELKSKIVELDEVLVQNTELEGRLSDAMQALSNSNTELEHANGALDILSQQNIELKNLLKDIYLKNSEAEQLVEDQREAIESLEREIIRVSSSQEKQLVPSVEDIEDALGEGTSERDQLLEKLTSLQDKLDIVSALADENQAIAAEARQDSEASKMYAEQKEEEVKILEHSIEELESTINVLEKKVHEMDEEVEKQRLIRDSLELELQALRHRLLTVEDLTESMSSENSNTEDQLSRKLHRRSLEINEAHSKIRFLEKEKAKQANEIRQLKDYISELVLHAEAQALQYQQKYKTLEAMLHEVKTDLSVVSAAPTSERADKTSARTRGSSSPFRCIAGLVQQMNQEKDQELSSARLHIEELEALAASRYKEVCMLNTRLATAESMTHDVIRDLLSVKLDISNYANIIDQHQLQRLLEEAQHHRQQFVAMEHEIGNLRSQIDDLLEERERCISEINRNNADQLDTQILVEQLQERDQLLIAQNDMLKMDKSNLQKRVAELDEMVKKLFSTQNQQSTNSMSRPCNYNLGERLAHSQKVLSRINDQLAQNRGPEGSGQNNKLDRRGNETKFRKHMP